MLDTISQILYSWSCKRGQEGQMNLLKFNSTSLPIQHRLVDPNNYEVIENKEILSITVKNTTIAGALLSFAVFHEVRFENCVFFGPRIENCQFSECKFIDCTFQFSECVSCKFDANQFLDCSWHSSTSRNCVYMECFIDEKTVFYITKSLGVSRCNQKQKLVA